MITGKAHSSEDVVSHVASTGIYVYCMYDYIRKDETKIGTIYLNCVLTSCGSIFAYKFSKWS